MNRWIAFYLGVGLCAGIFLCPLSRAEVGISAPNSSSVSIALENLEDNQEITESVPVQFRVSTSGEVERVKVYVNGNELGEADRDESLALNFVFNHVFTETGEKDISFEAASAGQSAASRTVRIKVIPQETRSPARNFNSYILKAVDYLTKNWGLLGYDITKQITHPLNYSAQGLLQPTGNGLTMCVSGVLETIITAFELYSNEAGHKKVYDFLPFDSWNTLRSTNIKAHIWVNSKLNSYGTADAMTKFGMGERVKFNDLEPGSFINLNRTTGSGHSVIFLSFIDIKGKDLAQFSDKVAGFRYFGAQGKRVKGKGGFGYRHAFFSKSGCPNVPYQRDCNVIFSSSQKLLNTGTMWEPANWKKKTLSEENLEEGEALSKEEESIFRDPSEFNGLTTDD